MALTTLEETQLRELLVYFEELGDVGAQGAALIASLLAGDTVILDLPDANPLNAADVLYVAQAGADVKATIQQFADFIMPLLPLPPSSGKLYFMGQI